MPKRRYFIPDFAEGSVVSQKRLSPGAKLLYIYMASKALNGLMTLGQREAAQALGTTNCAIYRWMKQLNHAGALIPLPRRGRNTPISYRLERPV